VKNWSSALAAFDRYLPLGLAALHRLPTAKADQSSRDEGCEEGRRVGADGAVAESHFESSSAFLRGFGLDNRAESTLEKVAEPAGMVLCPPTAVDSRRPRAKPRVGWNPVFSSPANTRQRVRIPDLGFRLKNYVHAHKPSAQKHLFLGRLISR
jgi:hypothetical protein